MKYVFWHKNPDTDAILSSMLYAIMDGWDIKAVRLGSINHETAYCLKELGWEAPELVHELPAWSEVVLVDHNEPAQTIDNLKDLTIVSIIDHHKFGLETAHPTEIMVLPIASTCSVIYWLWREREVKITPEIAKAMMMGIISDTLYFRSPTTTQYDKDIFAELNVIAQLPDPEALSMAMFAAKSDLGDVGVRELITMDYKEFESNGKKFGWASIETTNPNYVLSRKNEIIQDLTSLKNEEALNYIFLSVIDILNEHNTTIAPTEHEIEILHTVFEAPVVEWAADLGKRISRKKQLAAPLTEYLLTGE